MTPVHVGGGAESRNGNSPPRVRKVRVHVPRLVGSSEDFDTLATLWNEVLGHGKARFLFDFKNCEFLRPNAVIVLGGLIRRIERLGGEWELLVNTMHQSVHINLAQNNFIRSMGGNIHPWSGQSIHYREDPVENKNAIVNGYLKPQWIGKGWINISRELQNELASQFWEIYANAFEHSQSDIGVFSCGQRYPNSKELVLVVADFGVGIPFNARRQGHHGFDGAAAMNWAFTSGTTSASLPSPIPRGIGLDLLKDFIRKNAGTLEIYSHEGYALIDASKEIYQHLQNFFGGTLVQVRLSCDDHYYQLSRERVAPKSYF